MPAVEIPQGVTERLAVGEAQELIVEFDDSAVEREVSALRFKSRLAHDNANILELRKSRYRDLKQPILAALPASEFETVLEYSHLPMTFLRIRSSRALEVLSRHVQVRALYKNEKKFPILAQSLPLISQQAAAAAGATGTGTTAVVIDTGVNYALAAFGSCTSPGVPASCKVNFYQNIADTSTVLDSFGHGTNVSGVVLGVAPGARVAGINVFGAASSTTDALIIQAMNWAIGNQAAYNIAAINLSMGDGMKYTSACSRNNPFVTPVNNAMAAGIVTVAASGNDTFTNGISNPACTPGVVSVGAVYDSNAGNVQYANCTDSTTAADKVACFSNSASFLTMLAPGAMITAAGYTMAGTSQAAPHVAGAVAVLQSAYPAETANQTVSRLTGSGISITDTRNGIVKPRLNLLAAARPANDAFAYRYTIAGNSGNTAGSNVLATREAGEPIHAGNTGGGSVWWKWIAPAAGQIAVDTHGSGFNTLLAVYTGGSVTALAAIASNDNDGSASNASGLYFQAQANQEYEIAVDGNNGAAGNIMINWSLNTAAQADLSANIGASLTPDQNNLIYAITVTNNGPQTATNVALSVNLAASIGVVSAPGCAIAGAALYCGIGTLSNGAAATITISTVPLAPGTYVTSASVASDVPDPVLSNNTSSVSTTISVAQVNDSDVPVLPPWGMVMLAAILMALSGQVRIPKRNRGRSI